MGWASGSELAERVWGDVRKYIPDTERQAVANNVIDAFEDMDCDTMEECEQLMQDADRETYCWGDCDKMFPMSELDESHICKDCRYGDL